MPTKRLLATALIIKLIDFQESKLVQPYCSKDPDYEFLLNFKNGFDKEHAERMRRETINLANKFSEENLRAYLDIIKAYLDPKEGLRLQLDAQNIYNLSCSL